MARQTDARQPDPLPNRNYSLRPHKAPLAAPVRPRRSGRWKWAWLIVALVVIGGLLGARHLQQTHDAATVNVKQAASVADAAKKPSATAPAATTSAATACSSNASGQLAIVSISKRHMWACDGSSQVYDSAVVTGMENLAADLTPTGTYHIYGKYTDLHLKGSDSTGSWDDYVNYWMPFLHNQYGSYGFHDATWRAPGDFGHISPYSSNASHGCVELPLSTAKWLFNWAQIGTTVTIES